MSAKGLNKMIKNFEEMGSFEVQFGRGRKIITSTSIKDTTRALQEGMSNGVLMCGARLVVQMPYL